MTAADVHRLAIPTPFAVGRVNCWLIEDDPLTLVDTGPNSGSSLDSLERQLAGHGRRVEDLQRIVITHQHLDHVGLAAILARRSGAEVCALDRAAPVLQRFKEAQDADDELAEQLMLMHGMPADVVTALRSVSRAFRAWGAPVAITSAIPDGGTLKFAGRELRVWHRPGHSPTDTVFHDEDRGVLFGGDHLIGHISSNPVLSRPLTDNGEERARALPDYLRSLAATREMEISVVHPGHGEDVLDHRTLIDERFAMHERRARKIHKMLADRPRTAYEVGQELWGNVAVTQAFLTLSEVIGHVDLLADRGQAREVPGEDGVVRLEALG